MLAERVAAEDGELEQATGRRSLLDRVVAPLNQAASRRFLREARMKVWHNTLALNRGAPARTGGLRASGSATSTP